MKTKQESFVKGEVKFKLFQSPNSDYRIFKIKIEDTSEERLRFYSTCGVSGMLKGVEVGQTFIFKGYVEETAKYGYTYRVNTWERVLPTSKEGLIDFLSGDMFKGVGRATAEEIVKTLGTECIERILNNKDELKTVKGMNDKKAETIYTVLKENIELEDILIALYSLGISPKYALRIYDKYKSKTLEIIRDNPYQLIDDIDGIAFLKADKIAMDSGINPRSDQRVEACINYTLYNYAMDSGNTYKERYEVVDEVIRYLGLDYDEEGQSLVNESIERLIFKGRVVEYGGSLSDYRVYQAEKYIARKLKKMASRKPKPIMMDEMVPLINKLEKELGIQYEELQKEAIYSALINNVSIITGGPGTGKTTIERGIIYLYNQIVEKNLENISMTAPTGKAAKRIEESTKYRALTIHKLLGYDRLGNYFYDKFNPLPLKLLVIDEASMIDIFLFQKLLEALPDSTTLVIVGDSDQLPSIGPGQILKDLIDSKAFVTTKLTKIHRQKKDSKIISLAYDILEGEITTELDPDHKELSFIGCDVRELTPALSAIINRFLGAGFKLETDIQVLIPMYKGPAGIEITNANLQSIFNPHAPNMDAYKENRFYIDDKVIQLANQYEDSVMNGDMGVILDVTGKKEIVVDFQGNEVRYKGQDIQNISLAYAISIHKSQGSEFPVVILPIFSSYNIMLNKKLLYTAVTRAKDYLVLVGDFRAFNNAIKKQSKDRQTRIKDFL